MRWLANVFASAVVRKCAYLLVALALASVARCAHAENLPSVSGCQAYSGGNYRCDTRTQAKTWINSFVDLNAGFICSGVTDQPNDKNYFVYARNSSHSCGGSYTRYAYWNVDDTPQCATGEWLNPSGTECMSMDKCLSQNSGLGDSSRSIFSSSATASQTCKNGCAMDFVNGSRTPPVKTAYYTPNADGVSYTKQNGYAFSGNYEYTGYGCGANAPSSSPSKAAPTQDTTNTPKQKQDCVPVGNLTQCARADGTQCTSVSGTKSICWKPGETGTKTDGNTMQKSSPGQTQQPNNISLPNGDTATKTGEAAIQTTINNNTSNTTITNYNTTSGANAGAPSSDSGEPSDASSPKGDKDKNGNSAGGGGDCGAPPVCSGDAIACAQLNQQWLQRCSNDKDNNGQPDWTQPKDGDGKLPDDGKDGTPGPPGTGNVSASMLDMGGLGGSPGQCPSLGTITIEPFGSFNLDEHDWVCTAVAIIHAVMLILAVFLSIKILMS